MTAAAGPGRVALDVSGNPWGASDHSPFYEAGIPVLFLTTGTHEDYHRPSDTADKIDAAAMAEIGRISAGAIERLAGGARPVYARVARPPRGPAEGGAQGSAPSGAFLGSADQDPPDKPGIAHMATSLLDDGAGPFDANAFHDRLERKAIELSFRAGRDYFESKERCVFCDILAQEEQQGLRIVEDRGDYVAFCPYAPRVPYETWIMPRTHESSFERTGSSRVGTLTDLAALLRRTLQRIRTVTEAFHLVLHTSPNSQHPSATLGYWKTLDDDYHWHIEILPILEAKARSYTFKEIYYSPVTSETAVKRLRDAKI